tara:strand:+ start:305 stop:565 length:261 start_codon:yes stop_codon:yes gene_type:complete
MSREKAKEILDDNMSECTSHHVKKMDYLEQWIIDAMIEYAQNQAKNNDVLDLVICRGGTKKWSSLINSVQMSQIKKCNQNKYSPFR